MINILRIIGLFYILGGFYLIFRYEDPLNTTIKSILVMHDSLSKKQDECCSMIDREVTKITVTQKKIQEDVRNLQDKTIIEEKIRRLKQKLNNCSNCEYDSKPQRDRVIENSDIEDNYYFIDIKDAQRKTIYFGLNQFIIDNFSEKYSTSLGAFMNDMDFLKMQQIPFTIYVLGAADNVNRPNNCLGNPAQKIREKGEKGIRLHIQVHKPINQNQEEFSQNTYEMSINESCYKNSDLPNLRASFMVKELSLYNLNGEILQGNVSKQKGNEVDRNVSIILHIPKNSKY